MPIRLAIFDVDGTLLRGDTVCQTIARALGRYDRMCELEQVSDQAGILAARREMADWYLEAGQNRALAALEDLNWAPRAQEGIGGLREAGLELALASITWSFAVEHVAVRLSVPRFRSSELDFTNGRISHVWPKSKAEYLTELSRQLKIDSTEIAAVGDSSGDREMLEAAGLGIFVGVNTPNIPGIVHMPNADIMNVANTILNHR